MKNYLFTTLITGIICFCCFNAISQNLIPNPGFEIYTNCPTNLSQINYSQDWIGVGRSPDYFNSCTPFINYIGVPVNAFGYQPAHSGCGYAGIFTYSDLPLNPAWREFIQAPLLSTLTIGDKYFFSFHVALGSNFSATNKIGFRLATMPYTQFGNDSSPAVDNFASFYTDSIITDTLNWTKISGSIIADSAYKYITFGNFFDASNVQHIFLTTAGPDTISYYYIDDVCLSTDSLTCVSVSDTCRTSAVNDITEYGGSLNEPAFPNPFKDIITIEMPGNATYDLHLYDITGKQILKKPFAGNLKINTVAFSKGLYFYEISKEGRRVKIGKVMKE